MSTEIKRLYRSRTERMIGGVCGGFGEFLGIDPTAVRLGVVFVTLFWHFTPLVYLLLLLIVPELPITQVDAPANPQTTIIEEPPTVIEEPPAQ